MFIRLFIWLVILTSFFTVRGIMSEASVEVQNRVLLEQAADPSIVTGTISRNYGGTANRLWNLSGVVVVGACVVHLGLYSYNKFKKGKE